MASDPTSLERGSYIVFLLCVVESDNDIEVLLRLIRNSIGVISTDARLCSMSMLANSFKRDSLPDTHTVRYLIKIAFRKDQVRGDLFLGYMITASHEMHSCSHAVVVLSFGNLKTFEFYLQSFRPVIHDGVELRFRKVSKQGPQFSQFPLACFHVFVRTMFLTAVPIIALRKTLRTMQIYLGNLDTYDKGRCRRRPPVLKNIHGHVLD